MKTNHLPPEHKHFPFKATLKACHQRKQTHLAFQAEIQLQQMALSGFVLQQDCM